MKPHHLIIFLLHIGFVISCSTNAPDTKTASPTAGESELNMLFAEIDSILSSPQDSLFRGFHTKGNWQINTVEDEIKHAEIIDKYIKRLNEIKQGDINRQEYISIEVMNIRLQDIVDNITHKINLIPFNAEGGFYNNALFMLSHLPFNSVDDYQNYTGWLPQYRKYFSNEFDFIKKGLEEGVVAPKIIVKNTLNLLQPWLDASTSPLFDPLKSLPDSLSTSNTKLRQHLEQELMFTLKLYQEFESFMKNEYMAASPQQPGILTVPNGKNIYANRVRHYTTLPLSADSVHRLGLFEVKRIRQKMDSIISALEFKGDFEAFLAFLRTDPQFYPSSAQDLLNKAAWLSKKAEGELPKLFNKLYNLPFTVEPVPESIAPTYTTGRFVNGSWENKKPGIYWVNTYNLPSRTLYTLPALTLHEAVPGHHLQNQIAAEHTDIPYFRTTYYISAFGEGWGLYSEYLGEEMNMYETPYDWFGRYTYEMWRACRLVVDTGIHDKGWSRQQAIEYMASNTALSIHEVTTEINRYIGWPGQALSYKIGEIKIKQLRKEAEERLGEKFDIGDFHNVVLSNGSVPLTVLAEEVDTYINSKM